VAVLKQKNNAPVEVAHQVCIIYAVTNGYLNSINVDQIPEFETRLYEFMDNRYEDVLNTIRTTGKLEKDTEEMLKGAIKELLKEFGKDL
jgi:F-type H+-transporting ATPase subunit alpha